MESLMNEEVSLIETEDVTEKIKTQIQKEAINTKGLFVRVPNGYEIVAENLFGKLRTKKAGLRFFYPWDKKHVIFTKDTPIDFKKEKYKSSEGFEISVDAAITYHIVDSEKFYTEKNAIKQLKLVIGEILKTYASGHTFEQVNVWDLPIDLENIIGIIRSNNQNASDIKIPDESILASLIALYDKFGICVTNIIVQKAELSDELKRSKEEDALNEAKNKRMLATAQAELMAATMRADAEKAMGEAESSVIAQRIRYIQEQINGANAEQLRLIKAILLGEKAKYTVIENGMQDPTYSKLAYINENDNDNDKMILLDGEAIEKETPKTKTKTKTTSRKKSAE